MVAAFVQSFRRSWPRNTAASCLAAPPRRQLRPPVQPPSTIPDLRSQLPTGVNGVTRLLVIGDVHGQWDNGDSAAAAWLQRRLGCTCVVFVGDFGNEDVDIVQRVAAVDVPKAVVLGNHDAWYNRSSMRRQKRHKSQRKSGSPKGKGTPVWCTDGLWAQLQALGDDHVGYALRHLPGSALTLLGVRPFSSGNTRMTASAALQALYGVSTPQHSCDKILTVAADVPAAHALVVVGHNGPRGLGSARADVCGVDWLEGGGDHGDEDLADALAQMRKDSRHVALTLFGHMHSSLQGGGFRTMAAVDADSGTVHLNAAYVPRHFMRAGILRRHFMFVELRGQQVEWAANLWARTSRLQDAAADQPDGAQGEPPPSPASQPLSAASVSSEASRDQPTGSSSEGASEGSSLGQDVSTQLPAFKFGDALSGEFGGHAVSVHAEDQQLLVDTLRGVHGVVKRVWDAAQREWQLVTLSAAVSALHDDPPGSVVTSS